MAGGRDRHVIPLISHGIRAQIVACRDIVPCRRILILSRSAILAENGRLPRERHRAASGNLADVENVL